MTVKSSQTWTGNFVTLDATGALSTPSIGPVGTLYVAGVATADSVTISGTNPYKFSVPLPVLTAGQSVALYVTATIGGIATAAVVKEDVADTKYVSDLNDIAAGALMGLSDSAITAAKISSSALSNAKFAIGAIGADILGASAISGSNITTGAIGVGKLGASAIGASNIGGSALDSTVFKSNAIGVGVLAASVIGASSIGGSAFDSTVFKAGAIDAAAIATSAIASDEFAQSAADKVWSSSTRTLSQAAATVASILSGSSLTIQRGDSFSWSVTGLGSLVDYSEIWFTVKENHGDLDANSKLMVTAGSKLRYVAGGAPSSSDNGVIAVSSCALGNITVTISACETSSLVPDRGLYYDIQCKYSSGSVVTLSSGIASIDSDTTRAV